MNIEVKLKTTSSAMPDDANFESLIPLKSSSQPLWGLQSHKGRNVKIIEWLLSPLPARLMTNILPPAPAL